MMKKLLVAVAMFPLVASASELSVGTIEVMGGSNLGLNFDTQEEKGNPEKTKTTSYALDATGLYYVTPNIAVGLGLAYDSSTDKLAGIEDGLSTLAIGPAVAYEQSVAPQVSVFGVGHVAYASSTKTHTATPDTKFSGYNFGVDAGVKYFLVKSVSLNLGVGYNYTKVTGDAVGGGEKPEITTSGFGLNGGISVYFGGK